MLKKLRELLETRNRLVNESRKFLEDCETRGGMTSTEQAKFKELGDKIDELRGNIDAMERQIEWERQAATESRATEQASGNRGGAELTPEQRSNLALKSFFRQGRLHTQEQRDNYLAGFDAETRALSMGVDTSGGYLVMPQQFLNQLITFLDNLLFIRGQATVISNVRAASLGVPSLDTDVDDATWTTELQISSDDSGTAFGKREMILNPLSKLIKISRDLINAEGIDILRLIQQRIAFKIAATEENNYLNGSGVKQPLGVFTASADGIPTSRDVTSSSTTSLTFDTLKTVVSNEKEQYLTRCNWLFHRTVKLNISKLKDGNGQYLWQPSTQAGQPDMLLGYPVRTSEYAPSTLTTGLYVGLFGDFSYYWIADGWDLGVQQLNELYAGTNQIGFISRKKGDGAPVLAEAFTRIKLA